MAIGLNDDYCGNILRGLFCCINNWALMMHRSRKKLLVLWKWGIGEREREGERERKAIERVFDASGSRARRWSNMIHLHPQKKGISFSLSPFSNLSFYSFSLLLSIYSASPCWPIVLTGLNFSQFSIPDQKQSLNCRSSISPTCKKKMIILHKG